MPHNHSYIKTLFDELLILCRSVPPFLASETATLPTLSETDQSFITELETICQATQLEEMHYEKGQQLIERIIANYPHITPALNRDILWLLGGNCLHFLVDDEIAGYQALDELLYEAQLKDSTLTFQQAKAIAFKLH